MFLRSATSIYQDPLERIWVHCAKTIGFKVRRTPDAYASYDGQGTLLIATSDQFDPDDNLGQMIFHELCHALVEGDVGETQIDWGLDNTRMGHPWREHACLRAQAWLSDQFGLRLFLAPTTDYRLTFWDTLGPDPFHGDHPHDRRESSRIAGRKALWRAHLPRWHQPLQEALHRTRQLIDLISDIPDHQADVPSLWTLKTPRPEPHRSGHSIQDPLNPPRHCRDCAWSYASRNALRCQQAPRIPLPPESTACRRFESRQGLDCLQCGACCREAYDSVEVGSRDPIRKSLPEMVIQQGHRLKLRRENDRCAALKGGRSPDEAYRCAIYEERPKTCQDFTLGSRNCLEARRKVGLSL